MKNYKQSIKDNQGDNALATAEYLYDLRLIQETQGMPANGIKPTPEHKRVCLKLLSQLYPPKPMEVNF